MSGFNKGASLWLARAIGACLVLGMCIFAFGRVAAQDATPPAPWVAPDDAKKVKNPIPPTPETLAAAEQLFTDNCVLCHGEKGMGDGPGAKTIKVKPANFTDPKMQASETDGSLFWKMTNGRGPMPSWKDDFDGYRNAGNWWATSASLARTPPRSNGFTKQKKRGRGVRGIPKRPQPRPEFPLLLDRCRGPARLPSCPARPE